MPRMSVRTYLLASLLASSLVPLVLFGFLFTGILNRHLAGDVQALSQSILRAAVAEAQTRLLDSPRRNLPSLLLIVEDTADKAEIARVLNASKLRRPEYGALLLLDRGNRVIASTEPGLFPEGSGYTPRLAPLPGDVTFSKPFVRPSFASTLLEATYTNGERSVVALIDLDSLSSKLILITDSPSDRLDIVEDDGRYLVSSDSSMVERGPTRSSSFLGRTVEIEERDGNRYFVSSQPILGSSWKAVYYRSADETLAPLRLFAERIALLLALSLVSCLVVSYFGWRSVALPLRALSARIERISAGDYGERFEGVSVDEFGAMERAFDGMAEAIERRDGELKKSEEEYRRLFERSSRDLADKNLLLREVYHRVKNNLQIISSLLDMQAQGSEDPKVVSALRSGQDRVYAMALVHELVYQIEDLSSIDISDYATRLVSYLADAYAVERAALSFDTVPIVIKLDEALPFGLLLNELVSNAFKYGGPMSAESPLRISIFRRLEGPGESAILLVEDSGPGLPEAESARRKTLGFSLVQALATQLGGRVDFSRGICRDGSCRDGSGGRGLRVECSFPLSPAATEGGG
jgi:two-component sensor histidine kinase